MKWHTTPLNDVVVVEMNRHNDERGHFQEIYSHIKYDDPVQQNWRQANWARSEKGVLRGIHCAPYQKLVTCLSGKVWDVVVDLRKCSSTYLKWHGVWLTGENQIFVPSGCGHGYFAAEESDVIYFQNCSWHPGIEKCWHWNSFGIEWPKSENYILSEKDKLAPDYSNENLCI